jgi:hypothetical protein
LCGDYIATPAGLAWCGNLWCWRRLRNHWGRSTVHRCLIAEQGYSAARWRAIGICWRTRLDRELATDRARIPATRRVTSVVTCWWRRRRPGGCTRWQKRERDDPYDKCRSGN